MSFISILPKPKSREKNLTISRRRKSQLVVSRQVVTNQCCGLAVIFCGFIWHLIGRQTINIPDIFSGVHGFTGKTVNNMSMQGTRCDALFVQAVADCQNVAIHIRESHENFVGETLIELCYLAQHPPTTI